MIVLFWNIRGLCNDPARNMLREIKRAYNPDIIAIAEPKILFQSLRPSFWRSLDMTFLDMNSRENGLRPNLWVAYSCNLQAIPEVVVKSEQMIIIRIIWPRGECYFGFVHAANYYVERRRLWVSLLPFSGLNICVMGDFNAIVGAHEQIGQRQVHRLSCDVFRQFISESGLTDLDTIGPFYTWRSSHSGPILTSRLDRFLVSELFLGFWVNISTLVLPRVYSDHHPILLNCKETEVSSAKPFRFYNFWTLHNDFRTITSES